jgi:lysophospholipase L1-like esterase
VSSVTTPRARVERRADAVGRAQATPSRRVVWIGRLAIVLITVLLVLGFLEMSLRLFGPILPGNYTSGAYLERHPLYGFFHVRGYEGWQQSNEYVARVRFNQLGLRDPRERYEKPPGTFRILLLGDSFMEAVQVEQRETTASVLEARLRALRPDLNVEVINAGVAGWSTGIEGLYLDNEGYRFEPDLVLLSFFIGNDLHDNYYKLQLESDSMRRAVKPYFALGKDGVIIQRDPPPPPPPPTGLLPALRACCRLWNVIETGVLNRFGDGQTNTPLWAAAPMDAPEKALYDAEPSGDFKDGWEITSQLFGRLKARTDALGVPLAVFVVPDSLQISETEWREKMGGQRVNRGRADLTAPNDQVAAIADRYGLPRLDLLPALQQAAGGNPRRFYFETDQHWNRDAHALAARELERFLVERGLIPAPR